MSWAYAPRPGIHSSPTVSTPRAILAPMAVPDILDEALWGLEWMLKLHPARPALPPGG